MPTVEAREAAEAMREVAAKRCELEASRWDLFPIDLQGKAEARVRVAMLRKIAAAIRALPLPDAPSGWQPIETAPKDGTPILIFQPKIHDPTSWQSQAIYVCNWDVGSWTEVWGEQYATFEPTHWQPLPSPPEE